MGLVCNAILCGAGVVPTCQPFLSWQTSYIGRVLIPTTTQHWCSGLSSRNPPTLNTVRVTEAKTVSEESEQRMQNRPAALIGCKQRAARQAAVRLRFPCISTIKTTAAVATPIQPQTDTASLACQPVTCCTCLAPGRGLQCGETGSRRVRRENTAASRPLSHTTICHDLTNCESA